MRRQAQSKRPEYEKSEGKIVSQCPECREVLIKYVGDKYGPRVKETMNVFGPAVPKALCNRCVARLQI